MRNAGALTGLQIATYVVPVLTVPYLARVLGPHESGRVAFGQALGYCLAIIVEFGFVFSASRDVARNRDNKQEIANIVASVLGAKVVLSAAVILAALAFQKVLPGFALAPAFVWGGSFGPWHRASVSSGIFKASKIFHWPPALRPEAEFSAPP